VVSSIPAVRSLAALRGKSVVVPAIGAKDESFVLQVLLEGELPRDHFAKLTFAPDALSALAAVEHGRADAALVPSGLALPASVHQVATLRALSWPVLVALPRPDAPAGRAEALGAAVVAAAGKLAGQVFEDFAPGGGAAVQALVGHFAREARRPPLVVPPLRLAVGAILPDADSYSVVRADVTGYLVLPKAPEASTNRR